MTNPIAVFNGSCACERNQYQVDLPQESIELASVFFDNSVQSRRPQASPITAWLRIPLAFYHSATVAQFPDETHASIRRTYTTAHSGASRTTRRQFCGYCGTHLTAFDEAQSSDDELIDITLGSLDDASLDRLQELNILSDPTEDQTSASTEDELVKGGSVDHDTHIESTARQEQATDVMQPNLRSSISRYMQHRGMPYFEEMIENSSLGRIRRQKGGHSDVRTTVHWEIIEFDADDVMDDAVVQSTATKRVKLGA